MSAQLKKRRSPGSIGFRLAPRLNAAGRIGDAMKALEILTTEDEVRAASLAVELDAANRARQSMEKVFSTKLNPQRMPILQSYPEMSQCWTRTDGM